MGWRRRTVRVMGVFPTPPTPMRATFGQIDNLLDQFAKCARCKCKVMGPSTVWITTDLGTPKTWRILSRSNLQVVIVSLSFFAWNRRETPLRSPHLANFHWISTTVLGSGTYQKGVRNLHRWFYSRCQQTYRVVHGLAELTQFLSVQHPTKCSTDIGAKQPEFDAIHFVNHRVINRCESGADCSRRVRNAL